MAENPEQKNETKTTKNKNGFIECDEQDIKYYGAKKVVELEEKHIRSRRGLDENARIENDLRGIALSGGGIRSASFSLGVMQALAHKSWLEKIDYLSTVSGGGYIGSSLTWLLSRKWNDIHHFGVKCDNFPYGTYPMSREDPSTCQKGPHTIDDRKRGKMLRFLRQHAKYLTPGDGIDMMSFIAVILRGTFLSLLVYLSLIVVLVGSVNRLSLFNPWYSLEIGSFSMKLNFLYILATCGVGLFLLVALLYSLGTSAARKWKMDGWAYRLRHFYEKSVSRLLKVILMAAVMGTIPFIYEALKFQKDDLEPVVTFQGTVDIKGAHGPEGEMVFKGEAGTQEEPEVDEGDGSKGGLVGLLSMVFGIFTSIATFFKTSGTKKWNIPSGLLVGISTALLLFGTLLLAYTISLKFNLTWISILLLFLIALCIGIFANLNYVSVHRYYRDRLMESFLPDVEEVFEEKKSESRGSDNADKARLHEMCSEKDQSPYHIINTNIILVSSKIPKYRGRGGDNFILTSECCGSNATGGWQPTEQFMAGRMTLSTAMAISGAAVNPSTGVGGQGVTRQPFLSVLMGLLNIRLGYWAPNPNPKWAGYRLPPNFILPGLWEVFRRNRIHEEAKFVQLSDGGHFENLGLYELIRRRLKLIIICDGAADPGFAFGDLANAMEKVRADFGVLINITSEKLGCLVPRKLIKDRKDENAIAYAKRGYLSADIIYPAESDDNQNRSSDPNDNKGKLLYIKTTFFKELSADLHGYKKKHPAFPDEPTSDQFFDENQFEAYRELGYQTAWEMMRDDEIEKLIKAAP